MAAEVLFLRTPLPSFCCCGSHAELVGFGKEGSGFRSRSEDWLVSAGQGVRGCAGAAPACAASSARPSGHEEQAEYERGRVCWLGSGGWAPPCGHVTKVLYRSVSWPQALSAGCVLTFAFLGRASEA